jgi:hypothetical protein
MLNLVLFIAFLVFVAVALAMMAADEHAKVQAAERWPDDWHELIK